MIIPVKCVTCGTVIGDKYLYFQAETRRRKIERGVPTDRVQYMTPQFSEKTVEGEILDELHLHKMCCRRSMLTHVDIE